MKTKTPYKKKGWHCLAPDRYVFAFGYAFGFLYAEVRLTDRVKFALHENEASLPGNEAFQNPTKTPPAALAPHMAAIRRALDVALKLRIAEVMQRMEAKLTEHPPGSRKGILACNAVIAVARK